MHLYLVHHADAVGPQVDPQRPLSGIGRAQAASLAERAKGKGCAPAAIWHSGKLRARETAEAFYRHCSPFAEFKMVRGLRPDDPPQYACNLIRERANASEPARTEPRDEARGEKARWGVRGGEAPRTEDVDVMLVGHMPNLRVVLHALVPAAAEFPLHGMVALETADGGATCEERWRLLSQ